MTRFFLAIALLLGGLTWSQPTESQTVSEDWTERPDSRAPAGLRQDALLAPGAFEVSYRMEILGYEGMKVGTQEVPAILVLRDWDLAPLSMTVQRHAVELRAGILDWLGASALIPFHHISAELADDQVRGSPSASGVGDIEVHTLIGLHDTWPYRAHLIAGASLPVGSVDEAGQLPNVFGSNPERTLPYPMQPGDGTFAFLTGAMFVAENAAGTVGLRGGARIPVGENDRGWTRGNSYDAQAWMAYRFTDWVSGSVRISYLKTGNLTGSDTAMDAFSSPLAHPDLQSGSQVSLPIGINLRFPEGRLEGNRIGIELLVPVHEDLDGPQLTPSSGLALSWGVAF